MIADPYRVLGVNESASDTDLRKAYRDLSKKYHPDANPDNPQAAEEKFKEVQEAYRQIVDARARGTSAYGNASNPYGNAGGYGNPYGNAYGQRGYSQGGYSQDYRETQENYDSFYDFFNQWARYSDQQRQSQTANEPTILQAARNYIVAGHYQEALTALSGVESTQRNARWYYYYAIANSGLGNNVAAMEAAKRAADMEPNNNEYRQLLYQLQTGGRAYQQRGNVYYGGPSQAGSWCLSLCALNLCCGFCGGPGVFCC